VFIVRYDDVLVRASLLIKDWPRLRLTGIAQQCRHRTCSHELLPEKAIGRCDAIYTVEHDV
jgi:hypothetical protein